MIKMRRSSDNFSYKTWVIKKNRFWWWSLLINMIWDAPPLFVTVHHQCWTSYGMQYFRRIFFKPCSVALRIGRRAWWSGWFCTSASHLHFFCRIWSLLSPFRRFNGTFVSTLWGLLGRKKLLKPDGTMAFYKHDGSTLGFSVMFQGYTVYSRYTYYIDSKHLYKKCSLMGPLNEGHVFMKFQWVGHVFQPWRSVT